MDSFREGMILPSLITQLKAILNQYPDDGQILKELIQNAEDAGANKIIFLVDDTTYNSQADLMHHKDLAKFQGPALYAYNDAVFSEDDWKGIRMMQDSIKANDPLKVGRFGLGFKSVFHMTDLPSIMSGEGIGFIDPHRRYFQTKIEGVTDLEKTSSYHWHLKKNQSEIKQIPNQFAPFKIDLFGIDDSIFREGFFNGSLFRFPFRQQGMLSDLSQTFYNEDKIEKLREALEKDGHLMLQFLKNLSSIEFYSRKNGTLMKLLDIRIEEANLLQINPKRKDFFNFYSKQVTASQVKFKSNSGTRTLSSFSFYPLTIMVANRNNEKSFSHWFISQYFAGQEASIEFSSENNLLPLVGVSIKLVDDMEFYKGKPSGTVFCFLPLPNDEDIFSGFYFNVNGSFAVDQNRRHLKWPTLEQYNDKLTDNFLIWNQFLIEKVLPKAIFNLISNLINHKLEYMQNIIIKNIIEKNYTIFINLIYSIVPNRIFIRNHWKILADIIIENLWDTIKLYSCISGGLWMNYKNCIFEKNIDSNIKRILREILEKSNQPIVSIPRHVYEILPMNCKYVDQMMIINCIKAKLNLIAFSNEEKFALLGYCLEISADINFHDLMEGMPLLPLANGDWIPFCRNGDKIFIEMKEFKRNLLPGTQNQFLDTRSDFQKLTRMAGKWQFVEFDDIEFVNLLRKIFQPILNESSVKFYHFSWLTEKWLQDIWAYLSTSNIVTSRLDGLPLLPIYDDNEILKLDLNFPVISDFDNLRNLPLQLNMTNIFKDLGLIIIKKCDFTKGLFAKNDVFVDKYINNPDINGILSALKKLENRIGINAIVKKFVHLSDKQIFLFKDFLNKNITNANTDKLSILKNLPMYKTVDNSGGTKSQYISVNQVPMIAPKDKNIPVEYPECLLEFNDKDSKTAQILGAKLLSYNDVIIDIFLPCIKLGSYAKLEDFMKYICIHIRDYELIVDKLSEISFILNKNGNFCKANDLLDYKNPDFVELFSDENVFPEGLFRENIYYTALKKLGLKQSLNENDILSITLKISENIFDEIKIKTLLKILNFERFILQQSIDGLSLKEHLNAIAFIPFNKIKSEKYPSMVPFYGATMTDKYYATPLELFCKKRENLIGSVCFIIDDDNYQSLSKEFNWNHKPDIVDVISHLMNISTNFDLSDQLYILNSIDQIYTFLNDNTFEVKNHLNMLSEINWIWNGSSFSNQSQIIFNNNYTPIITDYIDYKPYFYNMPFSLKNKPLLWSLFNFPKAVDPFLVLVKIKEKHDNQLIGKLEQSSDLKLCINILNYLATAKIKENRTLYVPIMNKEKLDLRLSEQCAYCDAEWHKNGGFDPEDYKDTPLLHQDVPIATAEKLQIASLIKKTLGAEDLEMYESYSQQEPLTTRISNLLKDYCDGLSIIKELIQNADDAGATEIKILYDERENLDSRNILIDKCMNDLQGPAIWAYNNAVFTDNDFANIIKLGQATKKKKVPTATLR